MHVGHQRQDIGVHMLAPARGITPVLRARVAGPNGRDLWRR
ncbi:MAG: hypothetical protein Q6373_024445 [Candidatus Sigynarchaeota archaeon]